MGGGPCYFLNEEEEISMKSIFNENLRPRKILRRVNLTIAGVRKGGIRIKYLFIAVLVFYGLSTLNIQDMTEGGGRQWRQGIRKRSQHFASGSVRSALWLGGPSPIDQDILRQNLKYIRFSQITMQKYQDLARYTNDVEYLSKLR